MTDYMGGRKPTPTQAAFLADDSREALFVGEPGAGATSALLMGAVELAAQGHRSLFVGCSPGFSLPGGPLNLAFHWLNDIEGMKYNMWSTSSQWLFPSGGSMTMIDWNQKRYIQVTGWEFSGVFIDRLDVFGPKAWKTLAPRVRLDPRLMRGSCRPKSTWITPERSFHGARYTSNPYLPDDFKESLLSADPDFQMNSMFQ